MNDNPYSTPQADTSGPHTNQAIGQDVIDKLAGTRPWVLFMSIILFIGSGFMVIGGLGIIFAGSLAGMENLVAGVGFGALGFIYIAFALLYIFPALLLARYASRIKNLINHPEDATLADALDQQRKFWKFTGILTIVVFVLGILAGIVLPIIAAVGANI